MKTSAKWYDTGLLFTLINKIRSMQMNSKHLLVLGALMGLMLLTRTEHGTALIIPDASWAVFILAGFLLSKARYFVVLALTAWSIDLFAFRTDLSAAYCLTPGYFSLVFTWMVLWFGGWLVQRYARSQAAFYLVLTTLPTVLVAFVISNLGYYLYSSWGQELTLAEYSLRVVQYLPMYLASTTAYVALFGGLATLLNGRRIQQLSSSLS